VLEKPPSRIWSGPTVLGSRLNESILGQVNRKHVTLLRHEGKHVYRPNIKADSENLLTTVSVRKNYSSLVVGLVLSVMEIPREIQYYHRNNLFTSLYVFSPIPSELLGPSDIYSAHYSL
jgi:hypothetical protein